MRQIKDSLNGETYHVHELENAIKLAYVNSLQIIIFNATQITASFYHRNWQAAIQNF